MFWLFTILINIAIAVAASYAIAALTKKTPKDIVYEPDTFDFPEIKEGTKFPVVFGTCWIENPLVAWYGDQRTESEGVRLSDTDGQYVYLNKYYYGAHHILAQGTCDGVIQVRVADDVVWPDATDKTVFNADAAASANIDLSELYGGIHEHNANVTGQGGLIGTVDFQYGLSTQTLNSYLEAQQGSNVSANRGLTAAILRRPYIGLSTQLRQWKYLVKRTETLSIGETQWYAAKAAIRTYEINPIHILRECFTDIEWGMGMSAGLFNEIDWKAAADTLYAEGFGMCIKWEGDQSLEDFIKEILRYIDAVIYEDHSTGELTIKLIRDDYVLVELEEFDDSDIVEIDNFTRGTMHKVPDVTYVKYWNLVDNLPVEITSHDMALINSQNEILIPNDESFTGIIDDDLAGQLGAREQQQLSAFAATMQIKCKRTMSHLTPGSVFKLVYPPLGIVSMVVRVLTPHYGNIDDGIVTFDCMEDIFGMKSSLYGPPPATGWDDTVPEPVYDDEPTIAKAVATGVDPTVTIT